ncbi:MAG TPA: hypothetical protein VMZ71_03495 [Gemmataceae bacterium]|nr:hypothetical protein [Gemmataceae bacterium]
MPRGRDCGRVLAVTVLALTVGCGSDRGSPDRPNAAGTSAGSDPEKVRAADVSILFVGNSHTSMHDLPDLIGKMIRFRHPEKTVYSHVVGVGFLEDVARNPQCREEIESRPWKFVVLQAQKESKSGKARYSTAEGVDVAKLGKARGTAVVFYAEWGLRDVPGHGPRIEQVYDEMAAASGARVAPVGRAWDIALDARPELPLFDADGNHQSAVGAFLTASVLFGQITGESPATLAAFPSEVVNVADRKFLAATAAKALTQKAAESK